MFMPDLLHNNITHFQPSPAPSILTDLQQQKLRRSWWFFNLQLPPWQIKIFQFYSDNLLFLVELLIYFLTFPASLTTYSWKQNNLVQGTVGGLKILTRLCGGCLPLNVTKFLQNNRGTLRPCPHLTFIYLMFGGCRKHKLYTFPFKLAWPL